MQKEQERRWVVATHKKNEVLEQNLQLTQTGKNQTEPYLENLTKENTLTASLVSQAQDVTSDELFYSHFDAWEKL